MVGAAVGFDLKKKKKLSSALYSAYPRISERGEGISGCTECEIVSGGLVHVCTPFLHVV